VVASPEKIQLKTSPAPASNDRVAVLLMGYGEVESYDDFANYNEQALNLQQSLRQYQLGFIRR
jgi:ferrochelatase